MMTCWMVSISVCVVSAVYFEEKNYDQCIKASEEAVDIGRESRADYTLIAK